MLLILYTVYRYTLTVRCNDKWAGLNISATAALQGILHTIVSVNAHAQMHI